jgi:hypothetical protein
MTEPKKSLSPKIKWNEKFVNNVRMIYREIEIDRIKGIMVYEYKANNNIYKLSIKYNEDRGKFHALIDWEDKRQSLSFFEKAETALKNLELWIALLNGGVQESKKVNMVGD